MDNESQEKWLVYKMLIIALFGVTGFIALCMWAYPKYNVYSQTMEGRAILAHARSSREVAIAEAKAKMDSATLLAQADVERAKGTATSNKIIGESITPNYLRWLWIQGMQTNNMQVVYVPTEANIPILEAGKRGNWGDKIPQEI